MNLIWVDGISRLLSILGIGGYSRREIEIIPFPRDSEREGKVVDSLLTRVGRLERTNDFITLNSTRILDDGLESAVE